MDTLLKSFWPVKPLQTGSVTIPSYRQGDFEDSIELQIKSLFYMFRRCNIPDAQAFSADATVGGIGVAGAGGSDKYREQARLQQHLFQNTNNLASKSGVRATLGSLDNTPSLADLKLNETPVFKGTTPFNSKFESPSMPNMDQEKLDVLYSKTDFEKVMKKDEHRVLIDWKKNKFRSMCILSGIPPNLEKLPTFPVKNYSFIVLPAKSSDLKYITTLSESNLYIEHYVSKETRRRLAKQALDLGKHSTPSTSHFTKNDRALVIHTYLCLLAVEVQVDRLYKSLYRERIKNETKKPTNPLSIPEKAVPPKVTYLAMPQKPLTVSANVVGKTGPPKFYLKAKVDSEIPFSHRSSPKPTVPTVSVTTAHQKIQTTKPRIVPTPRSESVLARSRSNSPTRISSRSADSGYGSSLSSASNSSLRRKSSNLSLSSSGVASASATSSKSVSNPSKALAISQIPRPLAKKKSNPSLASAIPRPNTRLGNVPADHLPNNSDRIRQEVMAQTRKAVRARLDREKLLIQSENRK